jgi:phenylalanyl-tRNA synthetase beta chain
MKFTLSWLKTHLDTDLDAAAIGERLTAIGLELESITDRAAELAPFVVGFVVEAKQHPNADRLRVCKVDTGSEVVQVVCGAPNARTGMKGVFAPPGSFIPGTKLKLEAGTIRGEASNGMLLSERELGLSDDHEGIIDLPLDTPVGTKYAVASGLDDPVFDVAVTPNRQDCLGVRGIARDLAAAGVGRLKSLESKAAPGGFKSPVGVHLKAPDPKACPLFIGRYFKGVRNGPSPAWLKRRLESIGLRPISTLVDITNFVTFDLSRPLHVFDADKLKGDIHVRFGRGEKFMALNGKEYVADETMTAICDDSGVLGLGGIIGGESTGCSDDTVNVFLEVALFDPIRTATTGRKLDIVSDARYRFERGLDPAFTPVGAEIATRLITELCGGAASDLVIAGKVPDWQRSVRFRPDRVRQLGGVDVPAAESHRILGALGYRVDGESVQVPSWRSDVHGEADLVEDVLRIHGFDKIPSVSLPRLSTVATPSLSPQQRRAPLAKRALAARGMVEAVTNSFLPERHAKLFGGGDPRLKLVNPMSSELDTMRPSLLPNLLTAAGRNHDRGQPDIALFEVGPSYADDTPTGQTLVAGGVRRGMAVPRNWSGQPRAADAFDAKADAIAVLAAVGVPVANLQVAQGNAPGWYHPGRSGGLLLGPTALAWFGEMHPGVLAALDVKAPAVGFEVTVSAAPLPRARATNARPKLELSDLPAVERDFAFVVARDIAAAALLRAAKSADRQLIADAQVFDVYEGKGVPDGQKSIALTVRLEPQQKTLTDKEIEAVSAKIVAAVAKATGGTLRT